MCHAFSNEQPQSSSLIPAGVYTIPEMATVGLTEQQAIEQHEAAMVGTADFSQIARAHIMASPCGVLRMVVAIGCWVFRRPVMARWSWFIWDRWPC